VSFSGRLRLQQDWFKRTTLYRPRFSFGSSRNRDHCVFEVLSYKRPDVTYSHSDRNITDNLKMDSFEWTGIPTKVIFGAGKITALADVLASMNLHRCMILTTQNQRHLGDLVTALIGKRAATTFNQAAMHTPLHITEQAMEVAMEAQVDSTVSIGGGSTTGLGKALAVRLGIPQICIPTTYAGSEMTPTLGETVDGRKTTRRDEAIRPNVVIYDVNLTLELPVRTSLASGMNAIAHAGEFFPIEHSTNE
jgi:maleylacetate reductase